MFKVRAALLALAAMLIVGAATAAVASAQEGPVWHVNSKTFLAGEKAAFTGENYAGSTATMSTTIAGTKLTILCKAFTTEGLILGGNPGKGEGSIEYKECGLEIEGKLNHLLCGHTGKEQSACGTRPLTRRQRTQTDPG